MPPAWRGRELQNRPEEWHYQLTPVELAALRAAAQRALASGQEPTALGRDDELEAALAPALTRWRAMLAHGNGMVLVRGLPARELGKPACAALFWLIGLALGRPVPQNVAAERLVDIRDTGENPHDHTVRLYKTRAELGFHTDGADVIGLLCLRSGRSGGVSRICSSVEVYNRLAQRRPDLARLLEQPWHHHAHGQNGPGGAPTFTYPIVSRSAHSFRMLLLGWYIRNAAADFPEIAALSPQQEEALTQLEAIPLEDDMALDMHFAEGDMQFLKNAHVLHARSEYLDWDDPEEKRHLLRLWLAAPEIGDGDPDLRRGIAAPPTKA